MKRKWDGKVLLAWLRRYRLVALVLALGLVLLLWPENQSSQTSEVDTASVETEFDLAGLEQRLSDALSQISGVGETSVVLTLRSSSEAVLAQDISETSGEEVETVIVSAGTGIQQAVQIKTIYPEFQGALIVCEGGGSASVKWEVLKAVSAITGLSSDQISICQRK